MALSQTNMMWGWLVTHTERDAFVACCHRGYDGGWVNAILTTTDNLLYKYKCA